MKNARADAVRRSLPLLGLLLALLVFAGWKACTLAMALFWADVAPARASEWREGVPRAVFTAAEAGIRGGEPAAQFESPVRAALARSPLDGRGYRYLGSAAQARGSLPQADRHFGIAASRSPRDLPSLAWLTDRALARGDYADALARLDRMMRVQPDKQHHLDPVLLNLATVRPAHLPLARMFATNPPWRDRILHKILTRTPNVADIYPLVELMRGMPGGLTQAELSMWLDALASAGQWGPAYLAWVQSLSPEASQQIGNVYNGSFELEPGQGGFDWRFGEVAGAHISREQTTGAKGRLALRVAFNDQRVPFSHVRQMLALPPGSFRLSGRVRLDDIRSDRGLVWTVACAGGRDILAQTEPMNGRRDWSDFAVEFDVPAQKCGGQWLTLQLPARIPAEQRIGGVAWFDDVRIKSR